MMNNKPMLPANVSFNDDIFIDYIVTKPIPFVLANPPAMMDNKVTAPPKQNYDEVQETNASDFPLLRGFV